MGKYEKGFLMAYVYGVIVYVVLIALHLGVLYG